MNQQKRSQQIAGVLGANYQAAIQNIDFNKNIQQFGNNVNKTKILSKIKNRNTHTFEVTPLSNGSPSYRHDVSSIRRKDLLDIVK